MIVAERGVEPCASRVAWNRPYPIKPEGFRHEITLVSLFVTAGIYNSRLIDLEEPLMAYFAG